MASDPVATDTAPVEDGDLSSFGTIELICELEDRGYTVVGDGEFDEDLTEALSRLNRGEMREALVHIVRHLGPQFSRLEMLAS